MLRSLLFSLRSLQLRRKHVLSVVHLTGDALRLPEECANCGEPAGQVRHEAVRQRSVLVPYCSRCFAAASGTSTRALSTALASLTMGGTLLLTLPRLFGSLNVWQFVGLSAGVALLPLLLVALVTRRTEPGQSSSGRALWWVNGESLAGTRASFMAALAELNHGQLKRRSVSEPVLNVAACSGALLCIAVAPYLHAFLFPKLLVLNLAASEFVLYVDGTPRGRVEPSSLESREAGLRLRIPAGKHTFEARAVSDNSRVEVREAVLGAGGSYLFAPASEEFCFWLEKDSYGRDARARGYEPLPPEGHFWRLPDRVDTWFAANPATGSDAVSSGGGMVALRQARCAQVPGEVTAH